jgi:NACalpha-BTF3-like transcription factor
MSSDKKDRKLPKLTNKQLEIANVLRYMDERMLNIVEQVRAVAIAAGVSPEAFQKAFMDAEAQEKFYVKLHVAEDKAEMEANAIKLVSEQANAQNFAPPAPETALDLLS